MLVLKLKEYEKSQSIKNKMRTYSKKYNYGIISIPKTASTIFRQLFLALHFDENDQLPPELWHDFGSIFDVYEPKDGPFFPDIPHILVSRNPYSRIASLFCNKVCSLGQNTLLKKIKIEKGITFRNFIHALEDLKKQGKLNFKFDSHIAPQSEYINNIKKYHVIQSENFNKEIYRAYENIGLSELTPKLDSFFNCETFSDYLELLGADKKHFSDFYGLPLDKKKWNNQTDRKHQSNTFVGDTDFLGKNLFPPCQDFYDEELLIRVYNLYKEDFINFGYKKTLCT